jgi:hypothetical protein
MEAILAGFRLYLEPKFPVCRALSVQGDNVYYLAGQLQGRVINLDMSFTD